MTSKRSSRSPSPSRGRQKLRLPTLKKYRKRRICEISSRKKRTATKGGESTSTFNFNNACESEINKSKTASKIKDFCTNKSNPEILLYKNDSLEAISTTYTQCMNKCKTSGNLDPNQCNKLCVYDRDYNIRESCSCDNTYLNSLKMAATKRRGIASALNTIKSSLTDTVSNLSTLGSKLVTSATNVASQAVSSSEKVTTQALKSSADVTSQVIDSGADVTSQALKSGADVTSQALKSGADVTSQALKSGADVTSQAMVSGAELTTKAIDIGANLTGKSVDIVGSVANTSLGAANMVTKKISTLTNPN